MGKIGRGRVVGREQEGRGGREREREIERERKEEEEIGERERERMNLGMIDNNYHSYYLFITLYIHVCSSIH